MEQASQASKTVLHNVNHKVESYEKLINIQSKLELKTIMFRDKKFKVCLISLHKSNRSCTFTCIQHHSMSRRNFLSSSTFWQPQPNMRDNQHEHSQVQHFYKLNIQWKWPLWKPGFFSMLCLNVKKAREHIAWCLGFQERSQTQITYCQGLKELKITQSMWPDLLSVVSFVARFTLCCFICGFKVAEWFVCTAAPTNLAMQRVDH